MMLTVSDDQNIPRLVNERITDHVVKRSFEWSSNWTVKKTSPRTSRLRKRPLEREGKENIFSDWPMKERTSRTGRLMLVGTEISRSIFWYPR